MSLINDCTRDLTSSINCDGNLICLGAHRPSVLARCSAMLFIWKKDTVSNTVCNHYLFAVDFKTGSNNVKKPALPFYRLSAKQGSNRYYLYVFRDHLAQKNRDKFISCLITFRRSCCLQIHSVYRCRVKSLLPRHEIRRNVAARRDNSRTNLGRIWYT